MPSNDEVHVVIDVMMFSSSVLSLFDSGVSSVIPVHPSEDLSQYEDYMTGSETGDADFRNSPQNIYSVFGVMDSVPNTVALTSSNGAKVVVELFQDESVESLVIGSLSNAKAVANHIQTYESYSIHTAGSNGDVAIEDEIAKELIEREVKDKTIEYESVLNVTSNLPIERVFDSDSYEWMTEEDRHHATNINSMSIVPTVTEDGWISIN